MRIAPKYTPESQYCRMMMTLRGIDEHELARRCSVTVATIRNVLAASRPYPTIEKKIEDVLDAKIWPASSAPQKHSSKTMKTTESTIPEEYIPGVPEKFQPYAMPMRALQAQKQKLDADLSDNLGKLTEVQAELSHALGEGAPDDANIALITEKQIKVPLYENQQKRLQSGLADVLQQAAVTVGGFSREMQKIALETETQAQEEFFQAVGKLTANSPVEVRQALGGTPFTPPLRSKIGGLAQVLKHRAQHYRDAGDPFAAYDELLKAWDEFASGLAAVQGAEAVCIPE